MSALTLAIGVAVSQIVDTHLVAPRAMIKWPNDIYVDDRKLAGVLVEATMQGNNPPVVVVGVGLNVLSDVFPEELATHATSLAIAGGASLDRNRIAAELIAGIRTHAQQFVETGLRPFLPELRRRDYLRGKRVAVGETRGTVAGIDDGGCLLVGDHVVASGEVALL
jgi:BirA family biotin operon repressor/biotin-[acetyl-CoA-carboxylase] ligase